MRWSLVLGVAAALVAGALGLLWYVDSPSSLHPLSHRPADRPTRVLEPRPGDGDLPPLIALPDLSKVDRRLVEPAGLVKPRYCLLVFGPEAKTRVWIIEDGDTLYVDRNANGDLTEAGEAFAPGERREHMASVDGKSFRKHRDWTYPIGDVTPSNGLTKHTGFKLTRHRIENEPAHHILSVLVGGATLQYAGWGPLFGESRDTAPVVHFGGPIVPKPLPGPIFRLGEADRELRFCIGTPGQGGHSFAYVGEQAIPLAIQPVIEVAWPTVAGPLKERFALDWRC